MCFFLLMYSKFLASILSKDLDKNYLKLKKDTKKRNKEDGFFSLYL